MKIELSREEVIQALDQHVSNMIGRKATCIEQDYNMPRSVEFVIADEDKKPAEEAPE